MSVSLSDDPGMAGAFVDGMRPPERILPSEFAERYTWVAKGVTSNVPVPYSNDVFPFLAGIMNVIAEAIRKRKRGVVLMKPGQGGGSEAMIRVWAWLAVTYGGPILYLISKDDHARKFMKERFDYVCRTTPPLTKKFIDRRGVGNDTHNRIFYDGSLTVLGGGSSRNLESNPFRFVFVDEPDSIPPDMQGYGDPIALAENRTDAFQGETLVIVFSHPTHKERGTGKLYYTSSDQRRGFVVCPHCTGEFWLNWEHVKACPEEGQTIEQAKLNPRSYHYFAPCCGAEITDAQRFAMARKTEQKTTLKDEDAEKKQWLSAHFSHLYMSNKPLELLAQRHIDGLNDPSKAQVFTNKSMGDTYELKKVETKTDDWKKLIVIPRSGDDPRVYYRGQVPPEVSFLTAGQDSRKPELHWTVWGWGIVRNSVDQGVLCGWLIDYGVVNRIPPKDTMQPEDLAVFDQLIYRRGFQRTEIDRSLRVVNGFHDAGWQPVAVWEYCRTRKGRVYPVRGRNADEFCVAPYVAMGSSPSYDYKGLKVKDEGLHEFVLNTFTLKSQFIGMVDSVFEEQGTLETRSKLHLPRDVGDDIIEQLASEKLVIEKKKKKWKAKGPNHWGDCSIYSYAAALNLNPFQRGRTRDEQQKAKVKSKGRGRSNHGQSRGGGRTVRRSY